jgi:hypothetical protein
VDVGGHDADLMLAVKVGLGGYFALAGGDDSGTVGADETGFILSFEDGCDASHIMLGDSFCDGYDEGNFSGNGLQNQLTVCWMEYIEYSLCSQWRWDKDRSRISYHQ